MRTRGNTIMDKGPYKKSLEPVAARKDSPLTQFADKIGKVEILEKDTSSKSVLPTHGFYCSTCKASFTSSDAYLDHCNGRVHQKNLGISMKVERIEAVDRVKARLESLSKKQSENKAVEKETVSKQNRKESKKRKRQEQKSVTSAELESSTAEEDLMSSLMGFKSFS